MLYFEASALIKKYRLESGTEAVCQLLASQEEVASSILTLAETEAALGRFFREGGLSRNHLLGQRQILLRDWSNMVVVHLDDRVMEQVRRLVLALPLRAGDAIHLASALVVAAPGKPLIFCSADASLLRSAAAEGLRTWSPLSPTSTKHHSPRANLT